MGSSPWEGFRPARLCSGGAALSARLAGGACGWRAGSGGGGLSGGPPAGRERFLQSLLSAKGARRRPRERSSAGASGGLLPAGSGKEDAVWSSTRQTATTSHNFILESRPAAAPARAGGGETPRAHVRPGRLLWARQPRGSRCPPSDSSPPSSRTAAALRFPGHPALLPSP